MYKNIPDLMYILRSFGTYLHFLLMVYFNRCSGSLYVLYYKDSSLLYFALRWEFCFWYLIKRYSKSGSQESAPAKGNGHSVIWHISRSSTGIIIHQNRQPSYISVIVFHERRSVGADGLLKCLCNVVSRFDQWKTVLVFNDSHSVLVLKC